MTDTALEPAHLEAQLNRFGKARILCIGDVMLDRFVYGGIQRISPEAPVPVLTVSREETMLGGAGNVLRNILSLGAKCIFLSVVGDDDTGRKLTAMVGAEKQAEAYLHVEKGRISTVKTRYLAGNQQMLRADSEATYAIRPETARQLVKTFQDVVAGCDVVVLSDYAKGVLSDEVVREVIALAQSAGRPVLVDPKSRDFGRYRGAWLASPNLSELKAALSEAAAGEAGLRSAAASLMQRAGIHNLLVTRGQEGMLLLEEAGGAVEIPASAREVFDVSGAGDTSMATLAVALAAGVNLREAAALANLAAGIVVGKVGTAVVRPEDLLATLQHSQLSHAEGKICSHARLAELVGIWRREGKKIGFTNGCFDLLHPGHVSLLGFAKQHSDRLIVALNSDASVRRLKGKTRPVQPEAARALVLASLAAADAVAVFDEDTPQALIELVKPDVLIKGADYREDQVVGGDFVRAYGGRVLLAPLAEGHSTTRMIEKMV